PLTHDPHRGLKSHRDHVIDRGKQEYINATKRGHDGRSWKLWGSDTSGGRTATVMYCGSWDRGRLAPDSTSRPLDYLSP
ncbi:hypothetical protein A2U01_0065907, partial [Trifolium medium]|nr:hypothetical protein [Trifolium medium]